MMVTHRGQVKKTLWVLEILFLSTLPAPSFEPFFFSKKKKCFTPKRRHLRFLLLSSSLKLFLWAAARIFFSRGFSFQEKAPRKGFYGLLIARISTSSPISASSIWLAFPSLHEISRKSELETVRSTSPFSA